MMNTTPRERREAMFAVFQALWVAANKAPELIAPAVVFDILVEALSACIGRPAYVTAMRQEWARWKDGVERLVDWDETCTDPHCGRHVLRHLN